VYHVTAVIDARERTGAPAVTSLQFPPYSGAAAMRLTAAGTLSTRPIVTVYITYKMNLKTQPTRSTVRVFIRLNSLQFPQHGNQQALGKMLRR